MSVTLSRRLAAHVVGNRIMSAELEERMRLLLFDYYAVTAAGTTRASAVSARSIIQTSPARSTLFPAGLPGVEGFTSVEEAALVNGITAHGLELDDTHEESSSHPAVVVFPAVLAAAEAGGYSAQQTLTAAAVGYDVMCFVGVLLGAKESYGRGFHPTGVAGVLGAAAAIASLHGLNEDETTQALGLAANMASGSLEFLSDGSWTKRLNAGHAAATGLRAARLAAAGFVAPETSLEGRDGFLRQYGEGSVDGRSLHLEFGEGALQTSIKFYPCCRYMHGNIDLLREIRDENPGLGIADIKSIDVAVIKAGATLVSEPPEQKRRVATPVDAQFNMPFGAAVALATGEATVEQFDDAANVAANLQEWMDKVTCYTSDALEAAYPANWQAEVIVRLSNGDVIERSEKAFRGSPGDQADWATVLSKAEQLIGAEAASALEKSVKELSQTVDIRFLIPAPATRS
ncbi:2-methylcitrate dehydratase PrpD [Arthrobacter sp. yr096]|uniref:MmgE/PrpD family protein n=1 Tax=Arthrobacter sp. yr096 TaxID=1761750 RepID=UPI0008C8ABAC|nr:MmgE/PrpD family protein [Arthrobacter sp. yr096]SEJ78086.1 2-methylcitrate dehydratase PrpD [Arthrobacter sp. yr096]